jgi:hypothetical protein
VPAGFVVRVDAQRGALVCPGVVAGELAALAPRVQRVGWPLWAEPGARIRREVAEICRLQAARGLTLLELLAAPGPLPECLLVTTRLAGPRQERMYEAAHRLAAPVRALVVANWTWVLANPHGGQVAASYLASGAYPEDGYAAAHAAMALLRIWDRHPESRQPLAAAWAATRTPADWCAAAELRDAPVFTYPRAAPPPLPSVRPWVARLLRLDH